MAGKKVVNAQLAKAEEPKSHAITLSGDNVDRIVKLRQALEEETGIQFSLTQIVTKLLRDATRD